MHAHCRYHCPHLRGPRIRAENRVQLLLGCPAWPVDPALHVSDRADIEPGTSGQFFLSHSESQPRCPDSARQVLPVAEQHGAEHTFDRRPASRQRFAFVALPSRHRLVPAPEPLGEGSLREPPIHPPLPNPLPQGPRFVRVTPWEDARPDPVDPEIAEGQRNSVSVAGSGIRAGDVAAPPPSCSSITRASPGRCSTGSIFRSSSRH